MRFLTGRLWITLLGTGALVALVAGCGRTQEAGEEPAPESGQETVSCHDDPGYCSPGGDDGFVGEYTDDQGQYTDQQDYPTGSGGSTASGGASGEQEPGMAGAPNMDRPPPQNPNFLHMEGEGLLVIAGEYGPTTHYSAVARPEESQIHARLDDVEMRTGATGGGAFLLEKCEVTEGTTQVCQLTVHNINGSHSGSYDLDAPFDSRFGWFALDGTFVTNVVREGDSWSVHIQPEGLNITASRWDGPILQQRYEGEQLVWMSVEQQVQYEYVLPVTDIEVSCSFEACSLSLSAGSE